jgi:hypothetical protein
MALYYRQKLVFSCIKLLFKYRGPQCDVIEKDVVRIYSLHMHVRLVRPLLPPPNPSVLGFLQAGKKNLQISLNSSSLHSQKPARKITNLHPASCLQHHGSQIYALLARSTLSTSSSSPPTSTATAPIPTPPPGSGPPAKLWPAPAFPCPTYSYSCFPQRNRLPTKFFLW